MGKRRIFVSVASYRDPELIPTIKHCLGNALDPRSIRIGVAWQHCESEPRPSGLGVDLIDIDYRDSLGAGWARSKVQTDLYEGEDFFMQIDSHQRFVPGWDHILLDMMGRCDSDNPVLSSYVPGYKPDDFNPKQMSRSKPCGMTSQKFSSKGLPVIKPHGIPPDASKPLPGKFIAAGLIFAPREFVEKVPYDPNVYFVGEEITLAVRAYTHGFDLFIPNKVIIAHEYCRKGKPKHWNDHISGDLKRSWGGLDEKSQERCFNLLNGSSNEDMGKWGLGDVRSISEYEKYAGLIFNKRYIYPKAKPLGYAEDFGDWSCEDIKEEKYEIECNIYRDEIFQTDDVEFCRIAILDECDDVIFAENIDKDSLPKYKRREKSRYSKEIDSIKDPIKIVTWPFSKKDQWLERKVREVRAFKID